MHTMQRTLSFSKRENQCHLTPALTTVYCHICPLPRINNTYRAQCHPVLTPPHIAYICPGRYKTRRWNIYEKVCHVESNWNTSDGGLQYNIFLRTKQKDSIQTKKSIRKRISSAVYVCLALVILD